MPTDIQQGRFKLNEPTVAADVIDGEAIIINLAKGDYFSLSSTGADFWKLIVSGHSVKEIVSTATEKFGLEPAQVMNDLRPLVDRLIDEGLIVPIDDDASPTSAPAFASSAYESPELSVFSDVKELLALDPPLPDYDRVEQA
jgi:hypothetical protein